MKPPSPAEPYRIAVVLSPDSAAQVEALAGACPVWAVRSPAHEELARRVWSGQRQAGDSGLTLFDAGGESREATLISMLPVIDEHHGQWTRLDVVGARPARDVRDELIAYGVRRVEATGHGFTAFRR